MSEFRYETTIPVRYRDLDPLGHVNNAVYVTYLEHARISYLNAVLDVDLEAIDVVIANLEIDYKQSITLGAEVTVALSVVELGTSSFRMEYEVRVAESVVATAKTTQVVIDSDTGNPAPISDEWRKRINAFENQH